MKYIALTFCFCFVLLSAGFAAEPSWPVFHGPKGDNISTDTGLLTSWPEGGPKLLWKIDTLGIGKAGYASVAIDGGKIYTNGNIEENGDVYSMVVCLDAKEGKTLWTYKNGPAWTDDRMHPGTRSTPTIDGDYVYDESPYGQVACLDKKTGKMIWTKNILSGFDAKNITWALAESVIIDGDNVICTPGGEKACVAALNKKTGDTVWTTPGIGQLTSYATPYIFEFEGIRIIAVMNQKGGLCVDAKTGKMLFQFPHETKYDINATIPYYFDGQLFITSGYGTGSQLLKLTKDGDGVKYEQVWENKKFDNQHGGVVSIDGYVYGTTMNYKGGAWCCLRLSDGEIVWDDRGVGKGACTYAEGMIYGMSEKDGTVGLFKATPGKYEEVGRFQLPEEGEGMYWAHPVVCGKRLYLRHAQFLYCYDVAK